ncbi:MAG: flagellar hook-basal body complex protein FliE, partial [Planctomycetota bacterium]
ATEKADTAFRLLLQVRNKVLDAYDEVKQMRV